VSVGFILFSIEFNRPFRDAVVAQGEPGQQGPTKAAPKRPVILLTGFEPFGDDLPPNPSWEGIKQLDGSEWKGFQLVSKQTRVVWGAPLEQLQGWIAEYQPVAIFSFGQAKEESVTFSLESKARNKRKDIGDNRDEHPRQPTIVEGGPPELLASCAYEKLARLLAEKSYPIRVSEDAGRYLCNEMLYDLEYLKSTKKLEASVLFCHVPPLGAEIDGKAMAAEYVQQFVKDMLESWYALERPSLEKPKDPRAQEVKEMVRRYFRTWSDQDMDGYNDCFLDDACIQFIDPRNGLTTSARLPFVASQRDYHRNAPHRTIEVPETIDVRFEEQLARVVVHWKLTAGPRTERGYDHFTLLKQEGKWRIVNLVFYIDDK